MSGLIVLDASVTITWFVEDESDPRADAALEALDRVSGIAPRMWDFEVRNVLLMVFRRRRLSEAKLRQGLMSLTELPIQVEDHADLSAALALAERHGLTFYDALYLELALRRGAALATTDRKLIAAATAEKALFEA